jgi:hypothetical protein
MNATSVLIFAGVLAAGSVPAADVDVSKLPPPAARQGVTFDKDIHRLFEASCVRCHSGERPKAGLKLDRLENVLKGSKDGKVVIPGNSAKSQLVIAVARLDDKTAMPPKPRGPRRDGANPGNPPQPVSGGATNPPGGGPQRSMMPPPKPFTPEQVGLVRAWIDQGAK